MHTGSIVHSKRFDHFRPEEGGNVHGVTYGYKMKKGGGLFTFLFLGMHEAIDMDGIKKILNNMGWFPKDQLIAEGWTPPKTQQEDTMAKKAKATKKAAKKTTAKHK